MKAKLLFLMSLVAASGMASAWEHVGNLQCEESSQGYTRQSVRLGQDVVALKLTDNKRGTVVRSLSFTRGPRIAENRANERLSGRYSSYSQAQMDFQRNGVDLGIMDVVCTSAHYSKRGYMSVYVERASRRGGGRSPEVGGGNGRRNGGGNGRGPGRDLRNGRY